MNKLSTTLLSRVTYRVLLILLTITLQNCTIHEKKTPIIVLKTPTPDSLRFSGIGAGAGMMMMSSMGAAGIAIGVAIDEGISNDLNKALSKQNIYIPKIIKQQVHNYFTVNPIGSEEVLLHLSRYELKTCTGGNEAVCANIQGKIIIESLQYQFNYTLTHPKNREGKVYFLSLTEAKQNGEAIGEMFSTATTKMLSELSLPNLL